MELLLAFFAEAKVGAENPGFGRINEIVNIVILTWANLNFHTDSPLLIPSSGLVRSRKCNWLVAERTSCIPESD